MSRSMVREIIALTFALVFIFSFVSCRQTETQPSQGSENSIPETESVPDREESYLQVSAEEAEGIYLLCSATRTWGKETYEYDSFGRRTALRYDTGAYILYEYDNNGNLLNETSYDKSGKIERVSYYEYNDKGLVIKESRKYKNEDAAVTSYDYAFDGSGRTIHIDVELNGKVTAYDYTYSENGDYVINKVSPNGTTSQEKYTAAGVKYEESNSTGSSVYTYDDLGRLVSWILYDKDGTENQKSLFIYEDGKATNEVYSFGSLLKSDIYYYDENGNNVKITTVDGYGKENVLTEMEYIYFIPEK